jgi:ribosomal protein L37AE/L43A
LKKKEDILRPITGVQRCPKCQEENAPVAIYCTKCGNTLAGKEANAEVERLRAEVKELRGRFEIFAKAKYGANE